MACRNPELARLRAHKREDLLACTERQLQKLRDRVTAGRLTGKDKIGVAVGRGRGVAVGGGTAPVGGMISSCPTLSRLSAAKPLNASKTSNSKSNFAAMSSSVSPGCIT